MTPGQYPNDGRPSSLTRRRFVQQGAAAAAAAAALAGSRTALADGGTPAVLGGQPLRPGGWPSWPIADASEADALNAVLRSGRWYRYAGDSTVTRFEQLWSEDTGAKHSLAVSSGTSALITALAALDVGPGDEVLVPPYTFIATVNAVLLHHALPVFVDSDPATAQMDVSDVERRITADTRCVVPVHLGGASCDIQRLVEIARRHDVYVVEDSCQTHTGQWNGQRLGTFGDAGCFSFQNSKNLTSGEGGAVITGHDWVYHRAQAFHNNGNGHFGDDGGYTGNGGNFRLTPMQAALLIAQHQRLEQQSRRREANAAYLDSLLAEIDGVGAKKKLPGTTRHGYHLYVFDYDPAAFAGMTKRRFLAALQAEGVPASGGYAATNRMPWVEQVLQSRGFQRIYGKQRLDRWRDENHLPGNDRLIETACWLGQNVLLAEKEDMERIAAAVRRVQKHAAAIAKS